MSQYPSGSYETQFESQSGDEENLYNVERILAEKGRKYLIQWEGTDPTTGQKWPPDWVPKTDCTNDLIADWKREKAKMKRGQRSVSVKSTSSGSGSVNSRPPKGKSRPKANKSTAPRSADTSGRSRSPGSTIGRTTSRFRVYVDLPAPRVAKRRRESEHTSEVLSPVKRLKLGGPASPLPASPFDNDDGGVGGVIRKKGGPVTYKRRKPAVIKSPSLPKLTGPYLSRPNEAGPSRDRHPLPQGSTGIAGASKNARVLDNDNTDTETETETEDYPIRDARQIQVKESPLKSKSESSVRPQTRRTARTATTIQPPAARTAASPPRSESSGFVRPHPTSSARTRALPDPNPIARKEISQKIHQGMTLDENAKGMWPRVVARDERASNQGIRSIRSSLNRSGRRSKGDASVAKGAKPADIPPPAPKMIALPPPSSSQSPPPPPAPEPPAEPEPVPTPPRRSSLVKHAPGSTRRSSSIRNVSFHVDGVDDRDEYQDDHDVPVGELNHKAGESKAQVQGRGESETESEVGESGGEEEGAQVDSHQEQVADQEEEEGQAGEKEGSDRGGEQDGTQEEVEGTGADEAIERELNSSPSLGGGDIDRGWAESISSIQESDVSPPSQSPPLLPASEELPQARTDTGALVSNETEEHAAEASYEQTDGDISMAHAMEVDELLSSPLSRPSVADDHNVQRAEPDSVCVLSDSVIDLADSTLHDVAEESRLESIMDGAQALLNSHALQPIGRVLAPDTQPVAESVATVPQTQSSISTFQPRSLDSASQTKSQSQSLPLDTQGRSLIPPALPSEILDDVLTQPAIPLHPDSTQPPSQPQQDKTHSSIEDPSSSWNLPRPGQLPPPTALTDTISTFTPTNPSAKAPIVPTSSASRILPSSLAVAIEGHTGSSSQPNRIGLSPQANLSGSPSRANRDRIGIPASPASHRSSELGAVPEMSVDVFKRQMSPGSDIGQFSSPLKPPSVQGSPTSSGGSPKRWKTSPYSPNSRWKGSRNTNPLAPVKQAEIEERNKTIREQAQMIDTLLTELSKLEEAKKKSETETSTLIATNAQLTAKLEEERTTHTHQLQMRSETISSLEEQLEGVRSQFEIAESQREFAFDQYRIASTEAKRLSDENKKLEANATKIAKQLKFGLRQWQLGFESSVARHRQEVAGLKGQLELEREMYLRSKAPDLCRRAAEWYELKKRIEELEKDCAEAQAHEAELNERERILRGRELEVCEREYALSSSTTQLQSQTQTDQEDKELSQDDLQTETILLDRSAVLAGLNDSLGEDMVWMCSYRENSGKICGKAFDTMGLLLSHVLDAAGHSIEENCECPPVG